MSASLVCSLIQTLMAYLVDGIVVYKAIKLSLDTTFMFRLMAKKCSHTTFVISCSIKASHVHNILVNFT